MHDHRKFQTKWIPVARLFSSFFSFHFFHSFLYLCFFFLLFSHYDTQSNVMIIWSFEKERWIIICIDLQWIKKKGYRVGGNKSRINKIFAQEFNFDSKVENHLFTHHSVSLEKHFIGYMRIISSYIVLLDYVCNQSFTMKNKRTREKKNTAIQNNLLFLLFFVINLGIDFLYCFFASI